MGGESDNVTNHGVLPVRVLVNRSHKGFDVVGGGARELVSLDFDLLLLLPRHILLY